VKVTNAKASGNAQDGVVLGSDQDVRGCKLSGITVAANGQDGVLLQGSSNVVTQVRAEGNHAHGIELHGPGSGNAISKNSVDANSGDGIVIDAGNTGNSVQKNISFAHDGADLRDQNAGCAGDVWKQNTFETRSDPCID
jgi:hypothetical protein